MRTTSLITALLAVAAASPVCAEKPIVVEADAPTAHVSYADLNLGSTAGMKVLQARIRHAAQALCVESSRTDVTRALQEKKCFNSALASAEIQVEAASRSPRNMATAATIAVVGR